MSIQYTVPIKSYDNVDWRANIYSDSYVGNITTLKGSLGESMSLEYTGKTDDHFGVIIDSRLLLNVICENYNIDINQLQNAPDRTYRIEIQRNNILYWVGYMIAEGIQQPMKSESFVLQLEAICGLTMLDTMDYVHNNLPGVDGSGSRCPMNYFRQILFAQQNLNVPIPIRWTNNLYCTAFVGKDVYVGDVEWSPRGEGFNEIDVNSGESLPKKNNYILEGMIKSMQSRIYQANARWNIRRVPDYFNGIITSRQIPGNLNRLVVNSINETIVKRIGSGGYPFIMEDAVLTNIPGVKSQKTTYNADVRENILPNGNLNETSLGGLLFWNFYIDNGAFYNVKNTSLDGRTGNSIELDNRTFNFDNTINYFGLQASGASLYANGLPIDAKDLVKLINFSFLFMVPENGLPIGGEVNGFPVEGNVVGIVTGTAIQNQGSGYNNGVHTNIPLIQAGITKAAVADITVSGGAITNIVIRDGGSGYIIGNTFTIPPLGIFGRDFVGVVTFTESKAGIINFDSNPLQLQIVMNINDNQWFLDDFGVWKDSANTFISPKIESLMVGDVARIALDKFRGVILPEPDFKPKAGDVCDIKVLFVTKPRQVYAIDNISITIENSNDIYVSTQQNTGETKQESDSLNISSSFGGYMVSNFMTNWDRSDSESEFTDGDKYTGTLTGLTSDVMLRCKHTASKIFNGTINTRGQNWSFDEIYIIETLADRRFMPINAKYNIEKCEVNLVAIETRNDDISRTESIFGSNDKQLSN
jgi:hypothetical protein